MKYWYVTINQYTHSNQDKIFCLNSKVCIFKGLYKKKVLKTGKKQKINKTYLLINYGHVSNRVPNHISDSSTTFHRGQKHTKEHDVVQTHQQTQPPHDT